MTVGSVFAAPSRASRGFDAAVSVAGVLVAVAALLAVINGDAPRLELFGTLVVALPLIALLGQFSVSLGSSLPGPNEPYVTFELAALVFLVCTVPLPVALLTWVLGQLILALIARASTLVGAFNFGLLVTSGAVAVGVTGALGGVPSDGVLTVGRSVAVVAAGCAAFLVYMYLVLMVSVALESRASLLAVVGVRQGLRALGALVAMSGLGFLVAVMLTALPPWTLVMLAGPVLAVLLTAQALSRAGEQRQRLAALFDAAKQIQLSSTYDEIVAVLRDQAPKIVGTGGAVLREEPPTGLEFGAEVRNAREPMWVVGTSLNRDGQRRAADQAALEALSTVVEEALLRASLADEMNRLAHYDLLTGLPNRALFLDRARLAVEDARDGQLDVAVLFLDLDGFKAINDRFGHGGGDSLLQEVAARLLTAVRSADLVGRLGGDEFAVLVEKVASVEDLEELAQRIIDSLGAGVTIRDEDVFVGASIGIAVAGGTDDAEALIRNADLAMYDAKSQGRNRSVLFRPGALPAPRQADERDGADAPAGSGLPAGSESRI